MLKDPVCGMDVLDTSPFQLEREGKRHFFCSAHCKEKFSKAPSESCQARPTLKRTFVSLGLFGLLFTASLLFPPLHALRETFLHYLRVIWWAVGLGLLFGGLIDYYVPKEYISHLLSGNSKRAIFRATFLGFLLSACSHGVLAISMALYKKGASPAAVISFLLASPWANLSVTFLLLGLFGLKGVVLIVSAVIVALITGFLFQGLQRRGWIETNPNTLAVPEDFSIFSDIRKRWQNRRERRVWREETRGVLRSMGTLSEMVLPWVFLGVTLAGLVSAFVPQQIFTRFFGPTGLGLLATLFAATVIEICSEGSAPLAFELYRATGAFGNSFVFLMAGVATDFTEVSLLWANIGKRTALWMILITTPQILLLGFIFNRIF